MEPGKSTGSVKNTATDLFIPQLGQTVEEVTLIDWLVEDGAKVEFGTPVLDVETDKAVFPVEANASGFIHRGPFAGGQVVPVLTVVATIGKKDEAFSPGGQAPAAEPAAEPAAGGDEETRAEESAVDTPLPSPEPHTPTGDERRFASPRARKAAREKHVDLTRVTPTGGEGIRIIEKDVTGYLDTLPKATPVAVNLAAQAGLDLAGIRGTGIHGTITKADVERAVAEPRPAAPPQPEVEPAAAPALEGEVASSIPLSGVRKIIFDRMGTSVHTTARVTLVTEADATGLVRARNQLKEDISEAWGFSVGYNDLIGVITARALREHPNLNARFSADGKSIEVLSRVNLGMAVDTPRGLLVPVIQDADRKGLREFGQAFRLLVERARAGRSLPDDLVGGSFTITNLGMYEIDAFTPVINLPEAAILGVGRIVDKVVPVRGRVKVRKMLTLSLVFDHRMNDGAPAARFLQRIKQVVENPYLLLA